MTKTILRTKKQKNKFHKILTEFKKHKLTSRGKKVKSRKQAIAIAFAISKKTR